MSEETLKQNDVLKAIADLGKSLNERIDNLEKTVEVQFEAIRQGIIDNSIKFDRIESQIYSVRSDISSLKADLKETRKELV